MMQLFTFDCSSSQLQQGICSPIFVMMLYIFSSKQQLQLLFYTSLIYSAHPYPFHLGPQLFVYSLHTSISTVYAPSLSNIYSRCSYYNCCHDHGLSATTTTNHVNTYTTPLLSPHIAPQISPPDTIYTRPEGAIFL